MNSKLNSIFMGLLLLWCPVAFFVRAADGFTLTKELVGLIALVFFALVVAFKDRSALRQPLVVAALLFALWMTLVSFGEASVTSMVGPASFHLWLIAGTLLAVAIAGSRGVGYERLLHYSLATGVFLCLYSLVQVLGMDHYDWNTRFEARAFGTLGNPDYLGGYLAPLLPLAFVMTLRTQGQMTFNLKRENKPATTSQKTWFWLRALTMLIFVGLLLTRVVGSFLALGLAALFLGLSFLLPLGKKLFVSNRRYVLVTLAVLIVGAGIYVYRHGGLLALSAKQVSVEQRLSNYQVAWAMVKDHFWTGVGLGQIGAQYPRYQALATSPTDYPNHPFTYSEHVHNDFLQFWVEGGLIGLILFLVLLGAYALAVLKLFKNAEVSVAYKELLLASVAGMVALLGQSLSNFPLQVAPTAVLFGLFLAAPLALRPSGAVRPATSFSPMEKGAGALVLLVILVLSTRAMATSVALRDAVGEANAGKKDLALQYSNRLTQLDPSSPKAWKAQAVALVLNEKPNEAYEAYAKAVALAPQDVEAWAQMASLRVQQGQFQEGLELCEGVLAVTPNYYGPVWTRAVCLFQLKRYEESAKGFENFLLYAPNDAQTYLNLGVCYIQLHRKADAVAAWQKCYQLDPKNAQATLYLKSQGVKL